MERSVEGRRPRVGIVEVPGTDELIDLEFGSRDSEPRLLLAAAAFQHGEAAAAVVRDIIGAYLACGGLLLPPKKRLRAAPSICGLMRSRRQPAKGGRR